MKMRQINLHFACFPGRRFLLIIFNKTGQNNDPCGTPFLGFHNRRVPTLLTLRNLSVFQYVIFCSIRNSHKSDFWIVFSLTRTENDDHKVYLLLFVVSSNYNLSVGAILPVRNSALY